MNHVLPIFIDVYFRKLIVVWVIYHELIIDTFARVSQFRLMDEPKSLRRGTINCIINSQTFDVCQRQFHVGNVMKYHIRREYMILLKQRVLDYIKLINIKCIAQFEELLQKPHLRVVDVGIECSRQCPIEYLIIRLIGLLS